MKKRKQTYGFTILELLVVIALIGIFSTLLLVRTQSVQESARDTERREDIATISRSLESVYTNKKLGGPFYPDTSQAIDESGELIKNTDPAAFTAPGETTISLKAATSADASTAGIAPKPRLNDYVYQPLTLDNKLCTPGRVCIKFNLFYRTENGDVIVKVSSLHQQ